MARYLVTGGAGFIGSHLVEALVAQGHAVRVLDDLSTGRPDNLPPCAELVVASVTEPAAIRGALSDVDGCFHLAAIASVQRTQQEWWRSHGVNLSGTIAVFEEAYREQSARGRAMPVVYASSAAVYGNLGETPLSEDRPAHPLSPYGADKLGCEQHAAVAAGLFALKTIGLRFFNVYGPRQNPNSPYSGVISIFCDRLLRNRPLEIHGDGQQVRDFIYVKDVVRALQSAMNGATSAPQVFNVCTGAGISICRLGETVAQLCDVPFQARYASPRTGDVRVSVGDPLKASELLGFSARISLEDGLAQTLSWMSSDQFPKAHTRVGGRSTTAAAKHH
jgi:UDP-glucose 4-epimerase